MDGSDVAFNNVKTLKVWQYVSTRRSSQLVESLLELMTAVKDE